VNQTALSGNLTKDPELRSLPDGTPVCVIRIAVDDGRQNEPDYFDVEEFGASGEAAARHLRKGSEVNVSGKLKSRSWTDKETGKWRQAVWVRGRIEFVGRRPDRRHEDEATAAAPAEPEIEF
jgi:single-strand DNA-binding protein